MWDLLECLGKLLLGLIDEQFALILLVEIISLEMCTEVLIFRPISDSGFV
jgi:hypothetical protein